MGDERTNEVFIEDVFVPDEYVVGEVGKGFQYISQALDLERFTMFTFSPIKQRLDLLCELRADRRRATASRCATTRSCASASPSSPPRPRSRACLGLRVVAASVKAEKVEGAPPPTVESSQYKLFATEYSRRLADASMDLGAPGSQLRVRARRTRRWRAGPSRPTATR